MKKLIEVIVRKPKSYWLIALALILAGMFFGHSLEERGAWNGLRYRLYQSFDWVAPHHPKPKRTVLVLVDDDEYWKSRLARRVPIRRDYLANLLHAVASCDPAVIAIDFDLRSPVTDGSLKDNPEYAGETDILLKALNEVSADCPVILPATLDVDEKDRYTLDATIYDGIPLKKGKLQVGYIQPPEDARRVPTAVPLAGGGRIDSFAESIVRALNEDVLDDLGEDDSLPFGTFIAEERFVQVSAADLLRDANRTACAPIQHNVAILGAAWHRDSYNRGDLVDSHLTPTGYIRGAFVHANYVEALLDSRTYAPLGEDFSLALEFLFSAGVALLLAIDMLYLKKMLYVALTCMAVMLVSYFFWQNLGIFFDFFFPTIFLLIHAFVDYFLELQKHYLHTKSAAA